MSYIATYDVGTTAVKGVLVRDDGEVSASESVEIKTFCDGNMREQDPDEWFDAFCRIGRKFASCVPVGDITAVVMSGQMQDLILVDRQGRPLKRAILYSDVRAEKEAQAATELLSAERLEKVTGNNFDGSLPVAKLIWVKKNQPELYERTYKILISSKDYIINRLTGRACGDYTACSTAGAMNLAKKEWDRELIGELGLDAGLFPELKYPHEAVGKIRVDLEKDCGYTSETTVYAGIGDAGATTLASGISEVGEYNINLGTSGWVASVSGKNLELQGRVFNLAGFTKETCINVVPFFNAGNVHKWIAGIFSDGEKTDYAGLGAILSKSEPGSHGLLFLPYITGERFPVIDPGIRGCFYGITPDTSKADMARACLEGVAFSIRQGLELISHSQKSISLIGGGAREKTWCQVIADILGKDIAVCRNSDILPARAIAAAAMMGEGILSDYKEFTRSLQNEENRVIYKTNASVHERYNEIFQRFQKLYPGLSSISL